MAAAAATGPRSLTLPPTGGRGGPSRPSWCSSRGCGRWWRTNCATRNRIPPHVTTLDSAFHLRGCLATWGAARRYEAAMSVIPEGAGPVNAYEEDPLGVVCRSLCTGGQPSARGRVNGGAPAAQRRRTTLGSSRAEAGWQRRRDGCLVDGLLRQVSRGMAAPSPATAGRGQPEARVPVIPSPRRAAWSCAAAAGRAQSSGRPRRWAGVMTDTSTRRAAPEPFTSPPLVPGSGPGRRAGRRRPGSAACGRRRRGRCRCRAGRRCGGTRRPACCHWAAAGWPRPRPSGPAGGPVW
jgi:hypothetical protein